MHPVKSLLARLCLVLTAFFTSSQLQSQVIISQYYEGTGTNKWIELTNLGSAAVNTASPQLRLGLWSVAGSTGNISLAGAPTQTVNLAVTIPAGGSVLIGNTLNSTEVPYLTAASAAQTSNTVINFNGNDGVALLNASNAIIDAFGTGINATDISYVRSTSVTNTSATYVASQWTGISLATVQGAAAGTANRLGAHLPPVCATPTAQPTGLLFGTATASSIAGSFTGSASADEYLVVRSTSSTLSAGPVNGTVYNAGNALGGGTVVSRGTATSFTASGLAGGTTYYFFVFSIKSAACSGGPKYLTSSPLTGNTATLSAACVAPAAQPSGLVFGTVSSTSVAASFTASAANEFLVVRSLSSTLSANPVNGTVYNAGNALGGGVVVSRGTGNSFTASGLTASTTYYFFVFALNSAGCSGGPAYLTTAPLTGSRSTSASGGLTLNHYFGNLHAHSSYSDGNKDNLANGPLEDYAFAKTALCMDFLGISEHNHTGAGMSLANWQPGRNAAASSTTTGFVAMYGMEWGVISGGGHVIVYGMDSLIGWEPGQYQIFVEKSVYTGSGGLFDILNRHGGNALAYLAHPNTTDYNGLLNGSFDNAADNAIVGSAVESGPAFSTNTTYTNPATSLSYLGYYNNMLSRGYHLGPTIDHDNHNLTFGKTARTRLVVMAPNLTENDLLGSMRQMRFYASQDCGARITFTVNSQPLGSIFTAAGAPVIAVSGVTSSAISSIKIMWGVPGSGTAPALLTSSAATTMNFTHTALANLATVYYYADITEADGTRIITAPVWYTRNDAAVRNAYWVSLFPVNEDAQVLLKWTSLQEEKGLSYRIQRSVDGGRTFIEIGSKPGIGTSDIPYDYVVTDRMPYNGLALYRLEQTAADGSRSYSDWKAVERGERPTAHLSVYPNPVRDRLTLRVSGVKYEFTEIVLTDISGRRVSRQMVQVNPGMQTLSLNMGGLQNGNYLVHIKIGGETLVQKVVKY